MTLRQLHILNYRNINEAELQFSDKINGFVGLNGQGKTNLLDAIYLLSFTKSALTAIDSQNIQHGFDMAMVQGIYHNDNPQTDKPEISVSCGMKRGVKKQFRLDRKDYKRMIDHIGLIPLVMVSPEDNRLTQDGSDERRRFLDHVISQYDRTYLEQLTRYNALLKQRNALLRQMSEQPDPDLSMLEIYEQQMTAPAEIIFSKREQFVERFVPLFQDIYNTIADNAEQVSLRYVSQLQNRQLADAYLHTRQRDLILGWTSQGIHKDEIEMTLDAHPLKQVGSQGQQKTYIIAMKLAQALALGKPLLLLDDIFDRLDTQRVERILQLVGSDRFSQIFITDTDRRHLSSIVRHTPYDHRLFRVNGGKFEEYE